MWIFTNKGFFSVVMNKESSEQVVVRARMREHLRNIVPAAYIIKTPDNDYAYRAVMNREEWKDILMTLVDDIVYTNFKDSVPKGHYHDALLDVWRAMINLQLVAHRVGKYAVSMYSKNVYHRFPGSRE